MISNQKKTSRQLIEDRYLARLRDKFAGDALTGIMQEGYELTGKPFPIDKCKEIAADAYALADAMIEERRKK